MAHVGGERWCGRAEAVEGGGKARERWAWRGKPWTALSVGQGSAFRSNSGGKPLEDPTLRGDWAWFLFGKTWLLCRAWTVGGRREAGARASGYSSVLRLRRHRFLRDLGFWLLLQGWERGSQASQMLQDLAGSRSQWAKVTRGARQTCLNLHFNSAFHGGLGILPE